MEFRRVLQIIIHDIPKIFRVAELLSLDFLPLLMTQPVEVRPWKELNQWPPVEIVGVPVTDVYLRLFWFVAAHKLVVGLCLVGSAHATGTPHQTLDHLLHSRVPDEIELHPHLLPHLIRRHLWCGDIVRRVHLEAVLSMLTERNLVTTSARMSTSTRMRYT